MVPYSCRKRGDTTENLLAARVKSCSHQFGFSFSLSLRLNMANQIIPYTTSKPHNTQSPSLRIPHIHSLFMLAYVLACDQHILFANLLDAMSKDVLYVDH